MAFPDDVRKALNDPKHLYFLAGAGDLAVSKLREVPGRLASLRVDPHVAADRVQNAIFDAQTRLSETLSTPPDVRSLPGRAQAFALTSLGRAGEAMIRAHDGYEELAERGRTVVQRLRPSETDAESSTGRPTTASGSASAPAEDRVADADEGGSTAAGGADKPAAKSGGRGAASRATGARTGTKASGSKAAGAKAAAAKSAAAAKGAAAKGATRRGASGKTGKAADTGDTSGTA
jgi:hypothetical protein